MGADRLAVDDPIGQHIDLGKAGEGVFLDGVVFGLSEVGDEPHQVGRRHLLIADQDRAVRLEGIHDTLQGLVIGLVQIDIQDFGPEARLERTPLHFGDRIHEALV